MNKSFAFVFMGISAIVITAFSNCSGFQAEMSMSSSNAVLQSMGSVDLLRETYTQVYAPPKPQFGDPYNTRVVTTCSDIGSQNLSGNVVRSTTSLTLTITHKTSGAACSYSAADLRDHLIGDHKLVIPPLSSFCPAAAVGDYRLTLIGVGANGTSTNLLAGESDPIKLRLAPGFAPYEINVYRDANNNLAMKAADSMNGISPSILLGANQTGTDITVGSGASGFDELCDKRASPLLVQIHPGSSYINRIELSKPSEGVFFDILGSKDTPAHQKRLISWFTTETLSGNFFITLPNASGAVSGIDELFGDNTLGPDGKYAANGYEALRKYDVNHDGKITEADPVFTKLRLWTDQNHDGIAQPYELYSLDSYQVTEINLSYDASYNEADQYGNQIKLKSFVRTRDGLPHVMYDIWFKYY